MVAFEECVALEIAPGPQANLISWLPVKSLQNPLIALKDSFFVRLKMQCKMHCRTNGIKPCGAFQFKALVDARARGLDISLSGIARTSLLKACKRILISDLFL